MDEPAEAENAAEPVEAVPAPGPGEQLRRAREASGMTLEQVAAETRIPQRHLRLIEAGDFAALPARTYAIGFSKNFAKVVGLDEERIAADVRAELAGFDSAPPSRATTFEPGDPARVPGSNIIWIATGAVLVLLVIGYFGYSSMFAPAAELPSLLPNEQPSARVVEARPAARPASSGPVVFTALEQGVWVKFYDADGTQLMQKEMALGESYTVPPGARGPQLWTGRPDALKITVGGRELPRLAAREQIVKDVPVTAAALLARQAPAPISTPAPTPTPTRAQPQAAAPARVTAAPRTAPSPAARAQNSAPGPVASAIEAAERGRAAPTD
jgi:transcriptional regulator with XRE-family HTH domain